jgi:hypothetical protein
LQGNSVVPREAEMLAVMFVVSFLSVCGFYAYVFVHLERESKQLRDHKKHLAEHLYEMEPEQNAAEDREESRSRRGAGTGRAANGQGSMRRETLVQVSLAVGGLVALFAGIEILNSLVNRLYWC